MEGHPVGHIAGFGFLPDPDAVGDEKKLVLRAARRALREEMPRRVALLEAAPDTALALTPDHAVTWDGVPVARLVARRQRAAPGGAMLDSEFLDGAQRERLRVRLQRYLDDRIRADLAPLFCSRGAAGDAMPGRAGPLHRLTEALGVIPTAAMWPSPGNRCARVSCLAARVCRGASVFRVTSVCRVMRSVCRAASVCRVTSVCRVGSVCRALSICRAGEALRAP